VGYSKFVVSITSIRAAIWTSFCEELVPRIREVHARKNVVTRILLHPAFGVPALLAGGYQPEDLEAPSGIQLFGVPLEFTERLRPDEVIVLDMMCFQV
jgi:hypothetical protein